MARAPKKIGLAAVALATLAILAWVVLSVTSKTGPGQTNALEDFVARQIVGVVNAYLEPSLDFDTIELELPGTVRLTGARLTSPDGTDILDLDTLVITLTEFPKIGEPLHIARIEIDGGAVHLIRDPATGRFKGLDPILKHTARKANAAGTPATDIPESFQLSTVLRLEHITVKNLAVTLDDGTGGPPMRLDGFASDLVIEPTEDGNGWYALNINAGRKPGLTLDLEGAFNIDSFVAKVDKGVATVDLNAETVSSLPTAIQSIARSLDAAGQARIEFSGFVPLNEPLDAEILASFALRDFNVAAGDYRLPIDAFDARLSVANGVAELTEGLANAMQGKVTLNARAALTETGQPASSQWTIEGVQLRDALRASVPPNETPKLAGVLTGSGQANTSLENPLERLAGSGEVHVREGRLLVLPGMAELIQQVGTAASSGKFNHKADADFTLGPTGIEITKSEVVTGVLAARATGSIAWNGTLDLVVNAGPLERLQNALGAVGDIFGKITDQLVKYRVRGPIADPSVTVEPLGIGG
jgi:hypothetical protein